MFRVLASGSSGPCSSPGASFSKVTKCFRARKSEQNPKLYDLQNCFIHISKGSLYKRSFGRV